MSDISVYGNSNLPTDPDELRPAVLQSLILAKAILKGVPAGTLDENGRIKPEVLNLWSAVLGSKGATEHEIQQASVEHMASATFFPTPNEYLQIILRIRAKAEAEHEQFIREQRRRLEEREDKRIRSEWESLPDDEREQILSDRKQWRRKLWDDLQASMGEFDKANPERRVPGFMSMSDGIADLHGGDL